MPRVQSLLAPPLPNMNDLKMINSDLAISDAFAKNELTHQQDSPPWAYLHKDAYPLTPVTPQSDAQSDIGSPQPPVDPDEKPLVAVLGVGYVGSHLVSSFSPQYSVIGFDVSPPQIERLRKEYRGHERVDFTTDALNLSQATHFLISVPTLLRPDKSVDSSYLRSALETVGKVGRRGSTVVIESSVAVGMTRQLLGPLAQVKGFYAGMSPEVSSDASHSRPHTSG